MLIPNFVSDYPGAVVWPIEADNCYNPSGHGGVENVPRAFVLHTPEERADDYPGTPHWFRDYHPGQRGSTTYFVSYTGVVYQFMPEGWGAIANGFNPGNPQRLQYPIWAGPFSLNWQTISVEIEGYAANIHNSLIVGSVQWRALVALIRHRCLAWGIPLIRERIPGHFQLSIDRTDPGAGFPWDALMRDLYAGGADVFKPHVRQAKYGTAVGGWKGTIWQPGTKHKMWIGPDTVRKVGGDCDLPQEARMVRMEVAANHPVHFEHGDNQRAGEINGRGTVEVIPDRDGNIWFIVLERTTFEKVASLGYWTW